MPSYDTNQLWLATTKIGEVKFSGGKWNKHTFDFRPIDRSNDLYFVNWFVSTFSHDLYFVNWFISIFFWFVFFLVFLFILAFYSLVLFSIYWLVWTVKPKESSPCESCQLLERKLMLLDNFEKAVVITEITVYGKCTTEVPRKPKEIKCS